MTGEAPLTGNLRKMLVEANDPVDYTLILGEHRVHLNPHIGATLRLEVQRQHSLCELRTQDQQEFQPGILLPVFPQTR